MEKLQPLVSKYSPIKSFFKSFKRAYQRIKYGCCDMDSWNADEYLSTVIPNILELLRNEGHTYPGRAPYDTEEKWDEALKNAISNIRDASKWEDWYNPYSEEYEKYVIKWFENKCSDKGLDIDIDEIETLKKGYYKVLEDNFKKSVRMRNEGLKFVIDNYDNLWD